jgi:hypothetical protein
MSKIDKFIYSIAISFFILALITIILGFYWKYKIKKTIIKNQNIKQKYDVNSGIIKSTLNSFIYFGLLISLFFVIIGFLILFIY